jgi:spore coat protein U-like protein
MFTALTHSRRNVVRKSYLSTLKPALMVAVVTVAGARAASAQTATSSFAVTANVVSKCTISSVALSFGDYDPLVVNASTPLDASSSVTIRCTKGASSNIGLDLGLSASGSTRRMSGGGDFLTYELYKDASRTTVWGNSGTGLLNPGVSPSMAARTVSVYGRVPAAQDSTVAGYSDTITATITF